MAQSAGEITVPVSLETLKLTVKIPRALPLKIWIASRLVIAAAWIIGCGVEIEMKEDVL